MYTAEHFFYILFLLSVLSVHVSATRRVLISKFKECSNICTCVEFFQLLYSIFCILFCVWLCLGQVVKHSVRNRRS